MHLLRGQLNTEESAVAQYKDQLEQQKQVRLGMSRVNHQPRSRLPIYCVNNLSRV